MAVLKTGDFLKRAQTLRETEHRLRPGLRLKTIEEVRNFVHTKGLVSVLGGNELPSLISAILGKPWKPSKKGFTGWLDWWSIKISGRPIPYWTREMEREKDILASRIFKQSKTLVSNNTWPILTPIIQRHEKMAKNHEILSRIGLNILESLEEKGPTRTDHLRNHLRLLGKEHTNRFHRALVELESLGLIVGYEDPHPEKHLHANIWQPWMMRVGATLKGKTRLSYSEAMERLLERTIDGAVLAPEKDLGKWFLWKEGIVDAEDRLVNSGRILRVGSYLVTARLT